LKQVLSYYELGQDSHASGQSGAKGVRRVIYLTPQRSVVVRVAEC